METNKDDAGVSLIVSLTNMLRVTAYWAGDGILATSGRSED